MAVAFTTAREAAIREHKKYIGKNESPGGSNKTKFGKWFGLDPAPYCAMAVVATNAWSGSSAATVRSASSSAIQRWGVVTGRKVSTPQRGDLIHVYKNGRSVHIERVLSYSGGKLICIGSNTSNTSGGSTADGGGTYINDRTAWWRNRNSISGWSIRGVTRPFYGVTTEDVKAVQKAAGLSATGVINAATVAGVKRLQSAAGLKADGFPGPTTMSALTLGSGGGGASVAKTTAKPVAKSATSSKLAEDGIFGTASAKALQGRLGVTADGKIGSDTIKAWQKHEGTPVDGVISGQVTAIDKAFPAIKDSQIKRGGGGSNLLRQVQRNLNVKPVDGYGGHDLAKAMQHAINTNPNAFKKKG